MKNGWMIGGTVVALALIAWGIFTYGRKYEHNLMLATKPISDTTQGIPYSVPMKPETMWAMAKPILRKDTVEVYTGECDSLENYIDELEQPVSAVLTDSADGTHAVTYVPKERTFFEKFTPMKTIQQVYIHDIKYVEREEGWYEIPLVVLGTSVIVYAITRAVYDK